MTAEPEFRLAIVPEWIVRHPEVSANAVRLYSLLHIYSQKGEPIPGRNALCQDLGLDLPELALAREQLVEIEAITMNGASIALRVAQPAKQLALLPSTSPSAAFEELRSKWISGGPHLVPHTDAYFADYKARFAARKAISRHGKDRVLSAMGNYAEVLSRPGEYRFTHRYGFVEFCHRPKATPGVDYFIDEAQPLKNFRNEEGLTPEQIFLQYGSGSDDG